jgi:hypothetical protein
MTGQMSKRQPWRVAALPPDFQRDVEEQGEIRLHPPNSDVFQGSDQTQIYPKAIA